MKQLLLLAILLAPALLKAQTDAPKKNKLAVALLHPIAKERRDFERNLAQHNKDFHKGNAAVDVFEVMVGEHTGDFDFVFRNEVSWAEMEGGFKASEQKDHSDDWDINVASHLAGDSPFFIYETSDDSYLPGDMTEMNADMYGLYLIDINMGMEEEFFAGLKKIKEMFQKNNSKSYWVAHTRVFGAGTQVAILFPLTKGWASLEPMPEDDWSKMFPKAFPKEDFKAWAKRFNALQKSFESTVLRYRRDLSSPM
jgi:hypothetical protein